MIPSLLGFDYSTPIPASFVKATGTAWVSRYVTRPDWPKSLSAGEYADLTSAGIHVLLNFETTADFMLAGYLAGQSCARAARGYARACGAPDNALIVYSLDVQVPLAGLQPALDFLAGAASVDGKANVGAYGEYDFVKAALDLGYQAWGTVAWSAGQRDPRALAWQTGAQTAVDGVTVDLNDLNPSIFGGIPMAQIPASITAKWPSLLGEFPAGVTYDDSNAIIWSDAGARLAAENSVVILAALTSLAGAVATIQTAVQALQSGTVAGTADPAAVAADIVSHIHVE